MRRLVFLLLILVVGAAVAGCFNPFSPRVSTERVVSSPAPTPSSPADVVRLFVWCWKNRDPSRYAEVFTDDYRFIFAPNDSAGNPFRDRPWLREDEMNMALHLFTGGADQPPASDVQITIDNVLNDVPDPRPGHPFRWHRAITTSVDLKVTVTAADGTPTVTPVFGHALFYLVRGDSAVIPSELVAKGFRPDSTRWWIERWDDETGGTGAQAAARPAPRPGARPASGEPITLPPMTFGQFKALYWPASQ